MTKEVTRRNVTALLAGGIVVGMGGVAYSAVPLYRIFCQVTGFGGTTRRAHAPVAAALDKTINIRFDSGVARGMPWRFRPGQRETTVRIGEQSRAVFHAHNTSDRVVLGSATFNVTPQKAGAYFNKTQCFCFSRQVLGPGESAELPVTFFVDPAIVEDRALDDVKTITLSYTFFEQEMDEDARKAYEAGEYSHG